MLARARSPHGKTGDAVCPLAFGGARIWLLANATQIFADDVLLPLYPASKSFLNRRRNAALAHPVLFYHVQIQRHPQARSLRHFVMPIFQN